MCYFKADMHDTDNVLLKQPNEWKNQIFCSMLFFSWKKIYMLNKRTAATLNSALSFGISLWVLNLSSIYLFIYLLIYLFIYFRQKLLVAQLCWRPIENIRYIYSNKWSSSSCVHANVSFLICVLIEQFWSAYNFRKALFKENEGWGKGNWRATF